MTEAIPSDSKYVPLTQQRWCCVPTCIQIVMLRHQLPLVPAELIGYEMGLVVPEDNLKYFWNARTGERPPASYGTQIGKPEYGPNAVFKKLNIPLKMSWELINKFPTYTQFKAQLASYKQENDWLVCFDWGKLFAADYQGGHVCVLDKVDLSKEEIRFVDPDYNSPKWKVISMQKIYDSMVFHGKDKSAGFWILENLK